MAFVFWLSWLLTWRIGVYSGYWLVWHLVPGASGIRAAWRIGLVVNMAMVAALAVLFDRILSFYGRLLPIAATRAGILVSVFLVYGCGGTDQYA